MFQTVVSQVSPPPVSPPVPPQDDPIPASDAHLASDVLPPEAVRALAALFAEGGVVAHRPCFARLFGGAACGVLLSQFWFWTGTPTVRGRTDGWFWKPQREITEETGLTRAEIETARRRLRRLGVLEEERRGIPATLHFRLDTAAVMRRLWTHLQAQPGPDPAQIAPTGLPGTRTLVRGVPANKFARIAQSTSETLSERTREKTQTRARPLLPASFGGGDARRGAAAWPSGAAISVTQQAVNRGGTARLKAALAAAPRASARPLEGPGRAPPPHGE